MRPTALALLLLVSCASEPPVTDRISWARAELRPLSGKTEGDVVARLGAPSSIHEEAGVRVLRFERFFGVRHGVRIKDSSGDLLATYPSLDACTVWIQADRVTAWSCDLPYR